MFNLIRSPSNRKRRSKAESISSSNQSANKHEHKSILLSNRPSDSNLSISSHPHPHPHPQLHHHRHSAIHPFSIQHQDQHHHQHQTHQSSIPISQLSLSSPQQSSATLNQSVFLAPRSGRPQSGSSQSTSNTQKKSSLLLGSNFIRSSKLCYSSDLAFSDAGNSNNQNSLNQKQQSKNSDQANHYNMQISSPISVTVGRDANNLPRRPLQTDAKNPVTLVRTPSEAVRKMMSTNSRQTHDHDQHRSPPPPLPRTSPRTSSRGPQQMPSLTSPLGSFYSSPDLAARHFASDPKLYPVSQPLTQFTPSNSLPISLSNHKQNLQRRSNHRPNSDQPQSKLSINNPTKSSPLSDTISSYQAWISPTPVESDVDSIVPPGTAITTTTDSPRLSTLNPRASVDQSANRATANQAFPSVSPPRHQLKPSFTPHMEMGKTPAVILRRRPLFSAPSRPDSSHLECSQTRPISSTFASVTSASFETFLPNFPDPPGSSITSHRNEGPPTALQRTSLISVAGNPNVIKELPAEPLPTEPDELDSPTSYASASLSPPTSLDLKPLPIIPIIKPFKAHLISDLPTLTHDSTSLILSLNVGGQIFMTLFENIVATPSYLNDFLIQRLGLSSPESRSSDDSQWSFGSEQNGVSDGVKEKGAKEERSDDVLNEEDGLTSTLPKEKLVIPNKLDRIEIFIDRDPSHYTKILNFWRFRSIEKIHDQVEELALMDEAQWIGLIELVSLLKSHKVED